MIKLNLLFSVIISAYLSPVFAQQTDEVFQTSEPFSDNAIWHFNFTLTDNTIVHLDIADAQEKKITITKTGTDNLITESRDLYRSDRYLVRMVRQLGNRIYIFSDKNEKLFVDVIDPIAMTIGEAVPLEMKLERVAAYYKGDFSTQNPVACAVSPDGSKLMVYCRDGRWELTDNVRNRTFCMAVFSEVSDKPTIICHTFSAPSKLHALDIGVDNSGNPVFLLKGEGNTQSADSSTCSYSIFCLRNATSQPILLNPPPANIVAMKFAGMKGEHWMLAGYASTDSSEVADLMIIGEVSNADVHWSTSKMSNDYVGAYKTKDRQFAKLKDGSLGFVGVHPQSAFVGKDGSVSLVSFLNEDKFNNMGIKNDDILIFSFTARNEFAWADRIPYRQYYSIDCFVRGSKLYVLHFNQLANLSLSTLAGPDETPRKEQCKMIMSVFDMNTINRKNRLLDVPVSSVALNLRRENNVVGMATIRRSALKYDTVLVTFQLPVE